MNPRPLTPPHRSCHLLAGVWLLLAGCQGDRATPHRGLGVGLETPPARPAASGEVPHAPGPASPVSFTITRVSGDARCDGEQDCRIEVQGLLNNPGASNTGELVIRCDHLTGAGDPIPAPFLDRTAEIIPHGLAAGETRPVTFTLSDVDRSRTLRCRVTAG